MDRLTKEQRRKNMQAVRASGSIIERTLAKKLWGHGMRYRKNDRSVFGKPDLSFKKYKIAVFVDSEFWHGKNWEVKKHDIKTNKKFWINKINSNIARDVVVNETLQNSGWVVIRFWGQDVLKRLDECVNKIIHEIEKKRKDY